MVNGNPLFRSLNLSIIMWNMLLAYMYIYLCKLMFFRLWMVVGVHMKCISVQTIYYGFNTYQKLEIRPIRTKITIFSWFFKNHAKSVGFVSYFWRKWWKKIFVKRERFSLTIWGVLIGPHILSSWEKIIQKPPGVFCCFSTL